MGVKYLSIYFFVESYEYNLLISDNEKKVGLFDFLFLFLISS